MCVYTKFNDAIYVRSLVFTKYVHFSFIKQYRRTTLSPPCDVITMNIIFVYDFEFQFWFKIKAVIYNNIFKITAIFMSRQARCDTQIEYDRKIVMNIHDILSF